MSSAGLIDYVFECSDLDFLSDLKFYREEKLFHIIEKIPPEAFPTSEWLDLYSYLLEKEEKADSNEEIKEKILKYIKESL